MTQSITDSHPISMGNLQGKAIRLDVTSYPTGGFDAAASDLGLEGSGTPWILSVAGEEDNFDWRHDIVNDKIILFDEAGQITDTTNIGVVRITAVNPTPLQ